MVNVYGYKYKIRQAKREIEKSIKKGRPEKASKMKRRVSQWRNCIKKLNNQRKNKTRRAYRKKRS